MVHIIHPEEPLHHTLCDLLPKTFRREIGDHNKRAWHIHISCAANHLPSTAFCELAGTPVRAQILIDLHPVIPGERVCCIRHGRYRRVTPNKAPIISLALDLLKPLISRSRIYPDAEGDLIINAT